MPVHPPADGVTVIGAEIKAPLLFVAVNGEMFPAPDAARPIAVLPLVQLYVVPVTVPEKDTAVVSVPLQTVWLEIAFTVGIGLTVIIVVAEALPTV